MMVMYPHDAPTSYDDGVTYDHVQAYEGYDESDMSMHMAMHSHLHDQFELQDYDAFDPVGGKSLFTLSNPLPFAFIRRRTLF